MENYVQVLLLSFLALVIICWFTVADKLKDVVDNIEESKEMESLKFSESCQIKNALHECNHGGECLGNCVKVVKENATSEISIKTLELKEKKKTESEEKPQIKSIKSTSKTIKGSKDKTKDVDKHNPRKKSSKNIKNK